MYFRFAHFFFNALFRASIVDSLTHCVRLSRAGILGAMARKPTGRKTGRPRLDDVTYVSKKAYYDGMDDVPPSLRYKVRMPANVQKLLKKPAEEIKDLAAVDPHEDGVQLMKDVTTLFTALAKELPHMGAQIATLLSERARWHVLSSRFTKSAVQAGIETPQGMILLEKALAFSKQAESSAVKAYNLSVRLAEYEARLRANNSPKTPWLIVEEPKDIEADGDKSADNDGDGEKSE